MYRLIIFFLLLNFSSSAQMWQIKGEFLGATNQDLLGHDSRISGAGNTVIIGSAGANSSEGFSQVFNWNGSIWAQKGSSFAGDTDALEGRAIDINFDGSIVLTAAYAYDTPSLNGAGRVRAYQWDGSQWVQMGATLFGDIEWGLLGAAVSLSNDGHTMAVAQTGYSNPGTNSNGRVRIYNWNGNNWIEMSGSPIQGPSGSSNFGEDLSLGPDGTSLIIGDDSFAPQGSLDGLAQIFEFNGQSWIQKGNNVLGNGGKFGCSVSISSDGNTFIVGAKDAVYGNGTGAVSTFKWDGSAWDEIGTAIYDISLTQLGYAVELNDAGTAMIISSRGNFGKAFIYHWSGADWVQIGSEVDSGEFGDFFGISIDISSSGYSFIVGAPSNDQFGTNSGKSTVFGPDNVSTASLTYSSEKKLIRVTDISGRITEIKPNMVLIYLYSDGSHERIFHLE